MWLSKPKGASVALIDVSSSSVAGAFVRLEEGKVPVLCYTVRVPIEVAQGSDLETLTASAQRALATVGDRLVREGAPALRSIVGDGSVDRVLVSLASPWQEGKADTKTIQQDMPFIFTRSFAVDMLGPKEEVSGRSLTRTIIATLLNGYLTADPYGKKAKRAEVVVLSTSLDKSIISSIEQTLRKCFHTRDIRYVSFTDPSYRALQALYPHEKDFLTITVANEATEIVSVKRGHLVDTGAIPCGARGFTSGNACAKSMSGLLREFAARHALPRTVFLVADKEVAGVVKAALDDPSLHELWLSDVPVSAIPVRPSQFATVVKTQGLAEGDVRLDMLALAAVRSTTLS